MRYTARSIGEYWLIDVGKGIVSVLNLEGGEYRGKAYRGEAIAQSQVFQELALSARQILSGGRG